MSEDPQPSAAPPGSSVPPTPPTTPTPATGSTPAQPAPTSSTAPMSPSSSAAPIDYAMSAPKRPFTIPAYAGSLVKMILGFSVLLVMAYCALVALNPRARQWATQGALDGSGGPTPFNALNQILAIPARAIGKTKGVVAASDARVGVLDKVIADEARKGGQEYQSLEDPFSKSATGKSGAAGKDAEDKRVSRAALLAMAEKDTANADAAPKLANARPAAAITPPPGPAELKLAGGVILTNSSPAGAPPASAPFMYWVAGLNISGVSHSSPARFLMGGRLVQEGDEVNRQLAVTFDHLDAAAKLIYFRDKNGAVVTRSY